MLLWCFLHDTTDSATRCPPQGFHNFAFPPPSPSPPPPPPIVDDFQWGSNSTNNAPPASRKHRVEKISGSPSADHCHSKSRSRRRTASPETAVVANFLQFLILDNDSREIYHRRKKRLTSSILQDTSKRHQHLSNARFSRRELQAIGLLERQPSADLSSCLQRDVCLSLVGNL